MEKTAQDSQARVLVRSRPVYALCSVHYLLLDPLENRFGGNGAMRFVNEAGGVSGREALNRLRRRRGGMFVTRSVLEEDEH